MPSRTNRRVSRTFGGLASGAASGAVIGSVIPGIGTLVGGAIGGVMGLFGGLFGDDPEMDRYEKVKEQIAEGRKNALADASSIIRRNARSGSNQVVSSGARRARASGRTGETEALTLPGQEKVFADSSDALAKAVAAINESYDQMEIQAEMGAPVDPGLSDTLNTALSGGAQLAGAINQADMLEGLANKDKEYTQALIDKMKGTTGDKTVDAAKSVSVTAGPEKGVDLPMMSTKGGDVLEPYTQSMIKPDASWFTGLNKPDSSVGSNPFGFLSGAQPTMNRRRRLAGGRR